MDLDKRAWAGGRGVDLVRVGEGCEVAGGTEARFVLCPLVTLHQFYS